MKIWVIGRGVPTKKNRMLGQFELGQAKMLSAGNDVSYLAQIFTYNPSYGTPGLLFRSSNDEGVKVYSRTVPYFPVRFHIHIQSYIDLMWASFLRKVEEKDGIPDVIHVHYPAMICSPNALDLYRTKGVRIVCTEHWTSVLTGNIDPFEKKRLKKFVEIADAFICVGEPLKCSVQDLTGTDKDIIVVPNVVSGVFKLNKNITRKDTFRFVALGRLVPVKQFDKIIDAFAHLFSDRKDVFLTIAGNGSEYSSLKKQISSLGLEDRILLTGMLDHEETAELVSGSDCLICYSRLETFGVPIIEAWASGIPVISSDCLGFAEYWEDGLGVIVSHNNIKELEDAMEEMVSRSVTYDPQYISKYAQTHFSENVIRSKLLSVYSNKEALS